MKIGIKHKTAKFSINSAVVTAKFGMNLAVLFFRLIKILLISELLVSNTIPQTLYR